MSLNCKNPHHRKTVKTYKRRFVKKNGEVIEKGYTYDFCLTCEYDRRQRAVEYKLNRDLFNNKGLTELEKELIRILKGRNENKNLPNLYRLNRVVERQLRKRNTL